MDRRAVRPAWASRISFPDRACRKEFGMVASSSSSNGNGNGSSNGNGAGGGGCAFSNESLGREPSRFALAVQRVEACLASIAGINERITALAEQRRKIHEELRGIQGQINEEFERVLAKAGKGGGGPTKVVARTVKLDGPPPPLPVLELETPVALPGEAEGRAALLKA
jgi:hypothetical protein